jgi:multiple sugar transport system permease protein
MKDSGQFPVTSGQRRRRPYPLSAVYYLLLLAGAVTMLLPLLWMISTSLKDSAAAVGDPLAWIPREAGRIRLHFENYAAAWTAIKLEDYRLFRIFRVENGFALFYLNSLFVASCVTLGQVFTSSLAAFAFARLRFPGRDKLFLGYLATMMVPFLVMMIPVFVLLRRLGMLDSYQGLILPGIFSAYGTFMLRQFFMTVPWELQEAARVDGASWWSVYWRIVMPLCKPALATLTTFTFLHTWNDFIWPLIVVKSDQFKTLPLGLQTFQGLYVTNWTQLMAASAIFMVPVIIVFVLNQRFFVRGIMLSGIKG